MTNAPLQRIEVATLADYKFINSLALHFATSVGFLPRQAVEAYIQAGNVEVIYENGDPAGFLLGNPRYRWCPQMRPIIQAAISYDLHRQHLGLALVAHRQRQAIAAGQVALQCMCRAGLEANVFWKAAGFVEIGRLKPPVARKKEIICWRKFLTHKIPIQLAHLPPVAGHKAAKSYIVRR